MARSAHQVTGEFFLRPPIAGLKVLDGPGPVRDSIENVSPANARTVLAALRAAVDADSPYSGIHRTVYFQIRALVKSLEPISAVQGQEGGDSASDVAARVRTELQKNAVLASFFSITGTGANVVFTANVRAANDATMNAAYDNGTSAGLTPGPTAANTTAGVAPVAQVHVFPTLSK